MIKKKKPEDYPQFNFRLPSEGERQKLTARLAALYKALNKEREPTEYAITRAEILYAALLEGLNRIESGKLKLKAKRRGE